MHAPKSINEQVRDRKKERKEREKKKGPGQDISERHPAYNSTEACNGLRFPWVG